MSEWIALGYAITELGRDILPESVTGKGGEVTAKTSPLPYDFTDNILRYMEGIGR